jgi:hypothetical protein
MFWYALHAPFPPVGDQCPLANALVANEPVQTLFLTNDVHHNQKEK